MRRVFRWLWVAIVATGLGGSRGAWGATAAPPASTASVVSGTATSPLQPKAAAKAAEAQPRPTSRPAKQREKLPRLVIVVTATRMDTPLAELGTAASVVTGKLIESQQIHEATDALREVPGVQIRQSGGPGTVAEISIRGSTPAQTLVMIDGVPVNDSATSSFDLSRTMTDGLDRIEVVRGAGGALYGSQAIGGVVNMITREGSGAPSWSLLSEGGNRASQRQVLSGNGAAGKLAYSGALSYQSSEGYRRVNDNSDNLSGAARLDYHLDENTTLRGFARYTRANVSLAEFSNFLGIAVNPTAHQRNEFMLYKGEIDRQFGERLLARLSGYFVRDEIRLNQIPFLQQATAGGLTSESDHIPDETRGANLEAVYTWAQGFRSLVGFDFKDRWVHSQSDFFFFTPHKPPTQSLTIFNARRQEYAGYVEQEARLFGDHLIGTAGLRVDGNSEFGREVSPAWSVAIPIAQYGVTLRGGYSEGFRAPSFDELFFPFFGNPQLAPEISSEYDGGLTKTFGESAEFTANYFSRRVHHLIVAVPAPGTLFGSMAGNAGRVDVQGVELIPSVHPMRGLTLSGNVTILDQTHVAVTPTDQPTRVPKYSAAALIEYTRTQALRPRDRITATLAYTFVGDRADITQLGTIANHAAYHRFDLAAEYSAGVRWGIVRNETVVARIQNLLDRHYAETFGFPAPAVNFVAGLKVDF